MASYFVKRQSKIFGPVAGQNILDLAKSGKIRPTDEIATNQNGPWKLATSLGPLQAAFSTETGATNSLSHKEQQLQQREQELERQRQLLAQEAQKLKQREAAIQERQDDVFDGIVSDLGRPANSDYGEIGLAPVEQPFYPNQQHPPQQQSPPQQQFAPYGGQPYSDMSQQRRTSNRDPGMFGWYQIVLSKYATFQGRARRKEYWFFLLANMLVGLTIGFALVFAAVMTGIVEIIFLANVYSLAVMLPAISVLVRRLHDTGRSGWWYWILLAPLVGAIVLLIFLVEDSEPRPNRYGPNPK